MGKASWHRAAFFLLGIFCSLTLTIVGIGGHTARWFIRKDIQRFGELYNCCKISIFKIPLPVIGYPIEIPDHPISESEIIFMGDSYFGNFYGKTFEKKTGVPIFGIRLKRDQNPLEALEALQYKPNGKQKYLIFESVERNLQYGLRDGLLKDKKSLPFFEGINQTIKDYMINADKLEYFVSENQFMNKFIEARNTLRFFVFNDISKMTPVYSVVPPMLYSKWSVDGNRLVKTDEDIKKIANKIEEIASELKLRYGLTMIFFPIPNKYSLYGYDYTKYKYNTQGESYDNFLPLLQWKLEERSVLTIDLYHLFLNSKDPVFEPTNDHWNARGMKLGLNNLTSMYYSLTMYSGSRK